MIPLGTSVPAAALVRRARTRRTAEARALLARMSTAPTATRIRAIDTLIRTLKSAGVWSRLDALFLLAAHAEQAARLNWISANYDLTAVNSPAFVIDRGFTGNGAAYLESTYDPTTAPGALYTRNDAHFGLYISAGVAENRDDMGANSCFMRSYQAGPNFRLLLNGSSSINTATIPGLTAKGHTIGNRPSASTLEGYRDNVLVLNTAAASIGVAAGKMRVLASGVGAAPPSTKTAVAAHWGASLSAAQVAALNAALGAYLSAAGAV